MSSVADIREFADLSPAVRNFISKTQKLYIDGQWVDPVDPREVELIDPTREEAFARVTLGSAADADRAVGIADLVNAVRLALQGCPQ
jgi:hypothetical protein